MRLGAILVKGLATAIMLLSMNVLAKTEYEYLQNLNLKVEAINSNARLENLTLKTALTDHGTIYFDAEKGVFFTKVQPLVLNNGQWDMADKLFFKQFIEQIPDQIEVKSPNEKLVVYMFTDVSCGWCQKVHENMQSYTDAGITLKLMYFPRGGLDSQAARQMSTISRSQTPFQELQRAFSGGYMPETELSEVVKRHYQSAIGLGVGGTPMFFVNGYPFEGYLTPEQMLQRFLVN
ncbi:thioredoxin fold domain-containing protein [Vibrio sp.]|uniref:thioredoxin fold domain-containing protein n=1 Tax=Vibrio sp. TaxID=678 RepID=UPI003D12E2C3